VSPQQTAVAPVAKETKKPIKMPSKHERKEQTEAEKTYLVVCAPCHGTTGRGDGPLAQDLARQPRNYHDQGWQKSVTDDALRRAILEGGQAVGKSAVMPAFPHLKDKPEIVSALVATIRSFGE
jgi:mono/diheme cytochrome c family protein